MGRKKVEYNNEVMFPSSPKRKTEGSYTNYSTFNDKFTYLPNFTPAGLYETLEKLATYDETISKVRIDFVNSAMSGLDIKCENQEVKKALIKFLDKEINKNNGGITGLIRRWAGQAFLYDCVCAEIVIKQDLTGIEDVVVYDPKTVRFKIKDNKYVLCQVSYLNGELKELPEMTCFYLPTQMENDIPYSVPRLASAVPSVSFKNTVEKGILNQVDHWGFNSIVAKLDLRYFKKKLDESDAEYNERIKQALNGYQNAIMNKKGSQPILTTSVFDTTVLDGVDNAEDIASINSLVFSKLANALKVDKTMLNQGEFNTDVYNTVPYKNFLKQVEQAQRVIKVIIDRIVDLYKIFNNINDEIEINFVMNEVNDEFKAAEAEQMKTRATETKFKNGWIDSDQAAREVGYDKAALFLKPWDLEINKNTGGENGNGQSDQSLSN